ncbi:MAG: DUF4209 domain-containing protein [Leptospiraceae bacterium]|nr:DUF4209 domain-containing protein [Leptospiraceae bacterium]
MTIKEILEPFDQVTYKTFDEQDVSTALNSLLQNDKNNISEELKAEIMAFDFSEDSQESNSDWGTYFGPMMVWNNGNGTVTESPSIKLITPQMIDYWEKRANEVTNPILKARYSGLVWDFKNKITGVNASFEIGKLYINSLIEIASENFHKYEISSYTKLKRALTLAIRFNDNPFISKVKDAILRFEEKHSIDDKPGLWGYSLDLLVDNNKVGLSSEEEKKIIDELEAKLSRLTANDTDNQKNNPWAAEAAAKRLANYYRKKQKNEEVKRVILEIGRAYDKIISKASPLQASGWLDHLYKLYTHFNLREEADSLLLKIRELGSKVASELKPISHSFELPKKEMEESIAAITNGSVKDIIYRIAVFYIPDKEKIKEQIFELSKETPFIFHIAKQVFDEKGRPVTMIDSLDNDLEGHVVQQISQNLTLSSIFLRAVISEAINNKGLGKSDIMTFIKGTPIITEDRFEIIERALEAYFNNDFLVFIHLIIPQIEEAIRNIIEYSGGNVLKPSKGRDGYRLRTFDEILRDPIIEEILGEDYADYFRILFTDQRGWNLRNSVCHGMVRPNIFNSQTSDRVLHAFISLGLIKGEKSTLLNN